MRLLPFVVYHVLFANAINLHTEKEKPVSEDTGHGAPSGARTRDTLIKSQVTPVARSNVD